MAGSPPHYKGDGDWSSVYSSQNGERYIFPQKEEVGKILIEA